MANTDWSREEVDLIVADYFDMLKKELLGQPYSKTEHRQQLAPLLDGRSKGSIEFKHQNLSAVLVEMGLPYIEGYKPRGNFQSLLANGVRDYLDAHGGILEQLAAAPLLNPEKPPAAPEIAFESVVEERPERIVAPGEQGKPWITRKPRRTDFAARDASNHRLGRLGEEWVIQVEKNRLRAAGRDDLAKKVEWVSQTIGDGLGFDILSFEDASGTERLIEVKTTGLGKYFPFYVTGNELRCSEDVREQFRLYRVFAFARSPRLYVLTGSLRETCQLEPVQYRAVGCG